MKHIFFALALLLFSSSAMAQRMSPKYLANQVSSVIILQHAIDIADTSGTLEFSETSKAQCALLLEALETSSLSDSEKVALSSILNVSSAKWSSPDSMAIEMERLCVAITRGSWQEFGISLGIMPSPTPELRAKVVGILSEWVIERRHECASRLLL